MKKFFSAVLAVLLTLAPLLALSGCGGKEEAAFTVTLPRNVTSLDPQTATGGAARQVIGSLFEGLCRVGADSRAEPGVAERWEHNADHTVFTFHLRDARWSDGSPVTAEDFVFGVTRALDPSVNAVFPEELAPIQGAKAYYLGEAGPESLGVRAVNDRTLEIRLTNGYPDFPLLTAGPRYMPCSQEFFEECAGHYGLSAEYVLGNGPFTFPHVYAWDTDYNERSIRLVRANEYQGERPVRAAEVTYLIDYDDAVDDDPVAALTAGTVDLLELSEPLARQAEELDCRILAVDDGVTGLLLNPDSDALSYVGVRQLFFQTLEREGLLESALSQRKTEAQGLLADCVGWNGGPYYQPGETCYPLRDDGVTQGIPSLLELMRWEKLPSITVLCPDDEDSLRLANGMIAAWNAKLGSAFNIRPLPESELRQRVAWGDYEAALYTLRAGGATPYDGLRSVADLVYPAQEEDELPRSFDFNVVLGDLTFTRESFRDMENLLKDQYVFYPLLRVSTYYGLAPGVSGITVSPDGWADFTQGGKI